MIDKLYKLMSKMGVHSHQDKVLHIAVGFLVGIGLSFLYVDYIALIVGATIAVGKEYYDYKDYGKFDFFDMFVTLLGTVVGVMAYGFIMSVI